MKNPSNTSPRSEDEHGTPIVAPGTDSSKRCQPASGAALSWSVSRVCWSTVIRGSSLSRAALPLGLPDTLSRAPLRRRAPVAWLARCARSHCTNRPAHV